MLNAADVPATQPLGVIEYADAVVAQQMATGAMNTSDEQILANITASIRRGHPQMTAGPLRHDRICLVGSGPSLNDTLPELRQLVWEGATLVTMNGAYQWCVDRNLRPQTQIVMDARPSNARFVQPEVPRCNYVLASQCAPETWDAVERYPNVWIWHPVVREEGPVTTVLDDYYCNQWTGIGGGTTVATRAIALLRIAGYVRFDLFGVDCCWMGGAHHALPQPENNRDPRFKVRIGIRGQSQGRDFECAGWHIKQFEDLLTVMKVNGQHFVIEAHGDGMFAQTLRDLGGDDSNDVTIERDI